MFVAILSSEVGLSLASSVRFVPAGALLARIVEQSTSR